jgi:hypothetical protein
LRIVRCCARHIIERKEIDNYGLREICSDHKLQYNESYLNDDVYHVIYENEISKYNGLLGDV